MPRNNQRDEDAAEETTSVTRLPAPRRAEELLMKQIKTLEGEQVLALSQGRAQLAGLIANLRTQASVSCNFFDIYTARTTREFYGDHVKNLTITCDADLPAEGAGSYDLVCIPLSQRGESELAREVLQQAYQRLRIGGEFVASIDHSEDQWLHAEMKKLFPKVTRKRKEHAVIYRSHKRAELKKVKNYIAEFAFRDQDRLIKMVSRPGVFSHRRLDLGARALMEEMKIHNGWRVLDIGCGSGAVGIAAACRAEDVEVTCIDSNPRAIDCTKRSANLNRLEHVETILGAEEGDLPENSFDLAIANPPYFSNFRLAELFMNMGFRALKPGGRFLVVSKTPNWFREHLPNLFQQLTETERRGYAVLSGCKPLG